MATVGAAVVGGRAVAMQSQKATSAQSTFWGEKARPAKASATTSGSAAMPVAEGNALVDRCSKSDVIASSSILSANFAKLGEQCSHQFAPTLSNSSRSGGVKQRAVVLVRATNAEGPLRRPSTPGAAPSIATSPAPPSPPTSEPAPSPSPSQLSSSPAPPAKVTPSKSTAVSIEYQRQRAKELQEYFLDKKYEEQVRADRIFGWTRKNEITNGRWTMFGIAVGLLTEYATGSDFVEQLKIIISNLGIAELD